jgi:RmlD substrate binding domain
MVNSSPILIAGRNGRVARDLAEQAARLGFTARAVGRPELDIENVDAIARVMPTERPCAIVNAAAAGLVDEAERNPERRSTAMSPHGWPRRRPHSAFRSCIFPPTSGGVAGSLPRHHPPNKDRGLVMAGRTGRSGGR